MVKSPMSPPLLPMLANKKRNTVCVNPGLNKAMSSGRLFVWGLLVMCVLAANGACPPLPRPVLGKRFVKRLLAPETRSDAFYELILRAEENDPLPRWRNLPRMVFDDAMEDIRVTECPGRDGDAPLYLVTYKENFEKWFNASHPHALSSIPEDLYPPTVEELRRMAGLNAARGTAHLSKASLNEPIWRPDLDGKVLIFVDANGQIQWPHGGDNLGGPGSIIADLTGDGVLERIDQERYGFKDPGDKHTTFQVLQVRTIETTPKVLLTVVFNWHPESLDAANRWWYDVRKKPGDPLPVIVLGPQHGADEGGPIEKSVVEYHWDKAAGRYIGPDGRKGDHFRRLDVTTLDETWPKIAELQKEKSLGYPLLSEVPPGKPEPAADAAPVPLPGAWKHWPKYEHHSLAAMSDEDLFQWQYGGEPERDNPATQWSSVVIPPALRKLSPRDAALELAEANRTNAHRKQYDLILVNKDTPPPRDGVLVLDAASGWSGSYQELIRLDRKQAEWWRCTPDGGESGRWSHYVDTGGTLRWLAEVIAWLDRVRTVPRFIEPAQNESEVWESDHSRAGIVWQTKCDGCKPLEYRCEPQIAGRQWKGPYTRLVAGTLAVNLWLRCTSIWRDDRKMTVTAEDAVKALLPAKRREFTAAERLMIKPAIITAGEAGLKQFRPRLESLAEGDGMAVDEKQMIPASLKPFAIAALNELDHRDDVPALKLWYADFKRPECAWAGMRLRQMEAAANPVQEGSEPHSGAAQDGTKPVETWEQAAENYRATFTNAGMGGEPLELLLKIKGDHRRELWNLIKQKLDGAQGDFGNDIAAAYSADLRDIAQDDLAHLATASPEEEEGTRYNYSGGKNAGMPVDGRYHLARAILAVWQEPDALTRAKLLLLLGLKNADESRRISDVFGERLLNDLLASAASLNARDRARLITFARWCATDAVGRVDDYAFTKSQAQWLNSVMQEMKRETASD